ncbi:UNVERIFIED_CONTAM: Actin-depolymerizing factor [Sesamum latifolium]|uniref:Actin-depolymerizing factor n=1 Tax=Sesamum latifolium TaxID=2727402 RepID=A0AAW2Y0Z9_9LAMI
MLNYLFLCSGLVQINAVSGIGLADHSKSAFLELKRKRVHHYLIFRIDEKKNEVLVEKTGGPAENYDDYAESLPRNDCQYAVYDFDFVTSENCRKSKIFFIAWAPEISQTRAKMLYATSKDRLKSELDGVHYDIQATDSTEMDLEVISKRAR